MAEVDGKEQTFHFDRVFPATSSQQDVFNEVSELIQSALDGFQASFMLGENSAMHPGRQSNHNVVRVSAGCALLPCIVVMRRAGVKDLHWER